MNGITSIQRSIVIVRLLTAVSY